MLDLLIELKNKSIAHKTRNYVSTDNGSLREELYVWPLELREKFDKPNIERAKKKARIFQLLKDAYRVLDSEYRDEEEKRQKVFELYSEYYLRTDLVSETLESLPDEIIPDYQDISEGVPFEINARSREEFIQKIKEILLHNNLHLLEKEPEKEAPPKISKELTPLEPQLELFQKIREFEDEMRNLIKNIGTDKIKEKQLVRRLAEEKERG